MLLNLAIRITLLCSSEWLFNKKYKYLLRCCWTWLPLPKIIYSRAHSSLKNGPQTSTIHEKRSGLSLFFFIQIHINFIIKAELVLCALKSAAAASCLRSFPRTGAWLACCPRSACRFSPTHGHKSPFPSAAFRKVKLTHKKIGVPLICLLALTGSVCRHVSNCIFQGRTI